MSRSHYKDTFVDEAGNVLRNAAVFLYQPGTTTAPLGTMYDAKTAGTAITNPILTNSQGEAEAWCDTPQSLDLLVTDNANTAYYVNNAGAGLLSWDDFTEADGGAFVRVTEDTAFRVITAKTAAYPIVAADLGTLFTNTGATGSVTFTLPSTTNLTTGWWCEVYVTVAQTVVVASNPSDIMTTLGDAGADSISWATAGQKIGNGARFVFDGTLFLVQQFPATTSGAQTVATVTVAT